MIPFVVISSAACYFLFQSAVQLRRIRDDMEVFTEAVVRLAEVVARLENNVERMGVTQKKTSVSIARAEEAFSALVPMMKSTTEELVSVLGGAKIAADLCSIMSNTITTETDNESEQADGVEVPQEEVPCTPDVTTYPE